ncbi:MAG: starch synthase, partial [Oscillospiraceae bacterium]|nr:starch synthase [Oscillospiraceae bacterium]
RYGTIPIVRKTGGLSDTIRDCRTGEGNGFVFDEYNAGVLLETIRHAVDLYTYHPEDWKNLVQEAMGYDFSWDVSAKKYLALYEEIAN